MLENEYLLYKINVFFHHKTDSFTFIFIQLDIIINTHTLIHTNTLSDKPVLEDG